MKFIILTWCLQRSPCSEKLDKKLVAQHSKTSSSGILTCACLNFLRCRKYFGTAVSERGGGYAMRSWEKTRMLCSVLEIEIRCVEADQQCENASRLRVVNKADFSKSRIRKTLSTRRGSLCIYLQTRWLSRCVAIISIPIWALFNLPQSQCSWPKVSIDLS